MKTFTSEKCVKVAPFEILKNVPASLHGKNSSSGYIMYLNSLLKGSFRCEKEFKDVLYATLSMKKLMNNITIK